jgi:hypothetical protein
MHFPTMASNISRKMGDTYFSTSRPVFLCRPDLVSGTPIARDIFPLAPETPVARRHEKDVPNFLRLAIGPPSGAMI